MMQVMIDKIAFIANTGTKSYARVFLLDMYYDGQPLQ